MCLVLVTEIKQYIRQSINFISECRYKIPSYIVNICIISILTNDSLTQFPCSYLTYS